MTDTDTAPDPIEIRDITAADVRAALSAGFADFRKAPAFGLFFGGVFSIVGIVIYLQLVVWGNTYWLLPLMAGFPLVGPFLAVGLYDVSRRIEAGEPLNWSEILTLVLRERKGELPYLAMVTIFFLLAWVYFARLIFALSVGPTTLTNISSSLEFLMTDSGLTMLVIGTVVGGFMAFMLFSITVVSIPMVLDREVDFVTAMITSFQSVMQNKQAMLGWGAFVAVATAVAMLPYFLGIILVFPVLGHASWHLYRKVIAS